jgi:hypothetical protein
MVGECPGQRRTDWGGVTRDVQRHFAHTHLLAAVRRHKWLSGSAVGARPSCTGCGPPACGVRALSGFWAVSS